MTEGIHRNIPFSTYLSWPVLSQSVLKEGRESMAHLHAAELGERTKEVTDDMTLGTALHLAFLEPERMAADIAVWADGVRRGSKWDAFCVDNMERVILTGSQFAHLGGMVESMRRHPFVKQWAPEIEDVEVSIVGDVFGVPMKSRCDAPTTDPLVDIKKVRSTHPANLTKAVLNFGYHIQAAIYREQFNREEFVLLCVEDKPPYDVVPFRLSPALLREGWSQARDLLSQYKECSRSGVWPGRSDKIVTLEAPEFIGSAAGITIGGESAFDEEEGD